MFTPSAEQEELRHTVRRFLAEHSPESDVLGSGDSPHAGEDRLWQRLAGELDVLGIAVAEEHGGSGATFAEACIVLEEAGRASARVPLLGTLALVVPALQQLADDASQSRWLPEVVAGRGRLALAPEHAGACQAEDTRAGWRLRGRLSRVLDAPAAATLLVMAGKPDGSRTLFAVDARAPGVTIAAEPGLDLARSLGSVVLDTAGATDVGSAAARSDEARARVRDLALVGLAAEQVGGAQRALDASTAFAHQRVQFGRVIGSFQAVKHRLVDMLVAVETARSAAYEAIAVAVDGDGAALAEAAALAGSYCSEAFAWVAEEAIQVHGGLGFTWEHPAHLWFRRAKADAVLLGRPDQHRARLAALIA